MSNVIKMYAKDVAIVVVDAVVISPVKMNLINVWQGVHCIV